MFKNVKILVSLALAVMLMSSCGEYEKVLKHGDMKAKYELAQKSYNEGKYTRAIKLFEMVEQNYRGTPQAERINYFLAESYYKNSDYLLAAFYYGRFVKSYPESSKLEEAAYKKAYCYYLDSPRYSLDQENTKTAIVELQRYINKFSGSEHEEEANKLIKELTVKLEKKDFEIGIQYMKLEDYNAANVVFGNFINDYPDSQFREEVYFLKFKALYLYASNSFYTKQKERYTNAKTAFILFEKRFPESENMKEAKKYYEKVLEGLKEVS